MCGIFGAVNVRKAAELTAIGLHGIQHRAIDYAGMVSSDGHFLYRETGCGLSRQVFSHERLNKLHGKSALGHIRYPTVNDDRDRENIQPVLGSYRGIPFALVHNGNLTNTGELEKKYPSRMTSMDTEFVVRMLEANATGAIEEDLAKILTQLKGSFALGILFPDKMIAASDPRSNRPLSIGKGEESYFLSSETCAFHTIGVEHLQDVEPGTIVSIDQEGIQVVRFAEASPRRCPFEGIYFSHPSSVIHGLSVTKFRLKLGEALEKHCPTPGADIITPVPDSSNFIAQGYAKSGNSGTLMQVIIRNHYVGRTFIAASQAMRDEEVDGKFSFTESLTKGKSVVVVDDSIVRGTTLKKIVRVLRQLGAKEIHLRIACPLIKWLCRYGIYMEGKDGKLIAAEMGVEQIRKELGADSLCFLPLEVLKEVWPDPEGSCFACMDGNFW